MSRHTERTEQERLAAAVTSKGADFYLELSGLAQRRIADADGGIRGDDLLAMYVAAAMLGINLGVNIVNLGAQTPPSDALEAMVDLVFEELKRRRKRAAQP